MKDELLKMTSFQQQIVFLSNEIDNNQMQNNVCKDEVSKTSLGTDSIKLGFVLWVDLK